MGTVTFRKVDVDGIRVFYREAGPNDAPTILLLHGFPTAGHMFRDLIPQLADRFRLVAPDLPGFGQSDMPARSAFTYTFENIANVIDRFAEGDRPASLRDLRLRLWRTRRLPPCRSASGSPHRNHLPERQRL